MGKTSSKNMITQKEIESRLKKIIEALKKAKLFSKKKFLFEKKDLKSRILDPKSYVKVDYVIQKTSKLIKIERFISSFDIIVYYAQNLIDNSKILEVAQKNKENPEIRKLKPLLSSIMTLIWSSRKIKLEDLADFADLIKNFYSPKLVSEAFKGTDVDPIVIIHHSKLLLSW